MCGLYLSQVEESHRITRVIVVSPSFLTSLEELHIPDLSHTFRKKSLTYDGEMRSFLKKTL